MITKEQYQKALDDLNNSGSHGNGTTHLHIYTKSLNAIKSALRAQIEAPADDEVDHSVRILLEAALQADGYDSDVLHSCEKVIRAATKPAAPVWQTIDSAPKDGTHILVFCADSGCMAVAYYQHNEWDVTCYGGWESEPSVYPTHWQPLPQQPQAEG